MSLVGNTENPKIEAWGTAMQALIRRFQEAPLPAPNVEFTPGITIVDPKQWREALLKDIELGAGGPRAKTGALEAELKFFVSRTHSQKR